jgi:hypothetical protein
MRLEALVGRTGARGAKASARALLLLAGSLLLTACPPEGGDLVPVSGGEGASVATNGFEGDTLVVTREGLTLRARGRWSVADAATSVILDASNANAGPAAIDFGRGELSREGGGRMTLRSVARESGAGGAASFLPDKRAEVGGGASDTFVLEFKMDSEDGRSGVPRDVKGQTVTLRLPAEVRKGTTAEFVFGFKCEGRRPRR